jgi:hypothetical protein
MRLPTASLRLVRACGFLALFLIGVSGSTGMASIDSLREPDTKEEVVQASSDQFDWRIDLRAQGYPAGNPQLQWRRGLDQFSTIDFVNARMVAATFVTQEPIANVQRRDDPNRERPYRLHAIFLDTASGKILRTLEWLTDDPDTGIFPRYDGGFLFFSTERIVLYSADWVPIKELPLPQLTAPHSYLAGISESPSGKVLLVRFHQQNSTLCIRILTETLDGSESPCSIPELFTVSDDEVAASEAGPDRTENGRIAPFVQHSVNPFDVKRSDDLDKIKILIHDRNGEASTFCLCSTSTPQFVNNEIIVVYGITGFGVLNHSHVKLFGQTLDMHEDWIDPYARPVRPSLDGQRFAFAFNASVTLPNVSTMLGGSLGDIPAAVADHVDIFDLTKEQRIYKLKVEKKRIKEIWGLALSPNGERLAIDSGGVIQMYTLPARIVADDHNH